MVGRGASVKHEKNRRALRARAKSGDAAACCALAFQYAWSAPRRVVHYLRQAAELGHLDAQAYLGSFYAEGRHVRRDPRRAARLLWEAAERGSTFARMERDGLTFLPRATQRELNRFRLRAAAQGDVGAMYELGSSYLHGRGVSKNPGRAARWLLEAAESGHDKAWSGLDDLADDGFVRARDVVPHLRRAARAGDAQAQVLFGWRLENAKGARRNRKEALRWYRKAVRQGRSEPWLWLGNAYRKGLGARQSWPRALDCYRRAAAGGESRAFAWLVEYYEGNCGAPRDARAVAAWLRRAEEAARRGGTDVYRFLDDYYGYGFVDDPAKATDPRRAVRWLRKGVAEGDPDCLMRLGIHLFNGSGVKKDLARALALYRRAAALGESRAAYLLGRCYAEGDVVPRDRRRARRWLERAARDGESDARRALTKLRRA